MSQTTTKAKKVVKKVVKKKQRVLALSLRPKYLKDLVGQTELIESLTVQLKSGRIPHFFILSGPVGCGKTTLARIIALILQLNRDDINELSDEDWSKYKAYDIKEINAANKNGVDDMRELVEGMKYRPMAPSNAKVVILDEAHQLTAAAQNALITETEDVSEFVYYIFCTSAINKIIPALLRRAYVVTPKPLSRIAIIELLEKAQEHIAIEMEIEDLINALVENEVTSPGLVLQAAEKFFCGIPAIECVTRMDASKFDSMAICRAVASGNWTTTAGLCKDVVKADTYMLRACIAGYLKAILLKSSGAKGIKMANAIKCIADSQSDDSVCLPSFLAALFLACEQTKTK
jgi:DNA polymerase III delta prime subunit